MAHSKNIGPKTQAMSALPSLPKADNHKSLTQNKTAAKKPAKGVLSSKEFLTHQAIAEKAMVTPARKVLSLTRLEQILDNMAADSFQDLKTRRFLMDEWVHPTPNPSLVEHRKVLVLKEIYQLEDHINHRHAQGRALLVEFHKNLKAQQTTPEEALNAKIAYRELLLKIIRRDMEFYLELSSPHRTLEDLSRRVFAARLAVLEADELMAAMALEKSLKSRSDPVEQAALHAETEYLQMEGLLPASAFKPAGLLPDEELEAAMLIYAQEYNRKQQLLNKPQAVLRSTAKSRLPVLNKQKYPGNQNKSSAGFPVASKNPALNTQPAIAALVAFSQANLKAPKLVISGIQKSGIEKFKKALTKNKESIHKQGQEWLVKPANQQTLRICETKQELKIEAQSKPPKAGLIKNLAHKTLQLMNLKVTATIKLIDFSAVDALEFLNMVKKGSASPAFKLILPASLEASIQALAAKGEKSAISAVKFYQGLTAQLQKTPLKALKKPE